MFRRCNRIQDCSGTVRLLNPQFVFFNYHSQSDVRTVADVQAELFSSSIIESDIHVERTASKCFLYFYRLLFLNVNTILKNCGT